MIPTMKLCVLAMIFTFFAIGLLVSGQPWAAILPAGAASYIFAVVLKSVQ